MPTGTVKRRKTMTNKCDPKISASDLIRRLGDKCGGNCYERCDPQNRLACDAVCVIMDMLEEQKDG